eukprot:gene19371-27435_t
MKTQAFVRFASLLSAALIAASSPALAQTDKQDYSAAERLLFMTNQMSSVKPPASIRYSFRKSGSLEEGFEDNVLLTTARQADGTCCVANTDFFTGSRKLPLPETPAPEGNPVILHFLERDIAEMKRLTKGSTSGRRASARSRLAPCRSRSWAAADRPPSPARPPRRGRGSPVQRTALPCQPAHEPDPSPARRTS